MNILDKLEQSLKMVEMLNKIPLYYRCNVKTWNALRKAYPPNKVILPEGMFTGVQIRVYEEESEDGFHPVFRESAK